jgi:predicted CopG family antitoxin
MKKVNDEESDTTDASAEANVNVDVTPEPAVMKRPVKTPKRVKQNQNEDRRKDLTAKKIVLFQNILVRMNILFDLKKYKKGKEYRSAMINGLYEKKSENNGKSIMQLFNTLPNLDLEKNKT